MTRKPAVKVTTDAESPPTEVIAQAIIKLAEGVRAMNASRLKREAIVALLHDESKIAKATIRIVLNNLDDLEATWLKPKPARKAPR